MLLPKGTTLEIEFWKRLPKGGHDECWHWKGCVCSTHGYGLFRFKQKNHRAHRLAWEIMVGPIPDGHVVRHQCFSKTCCNPKHLLTGTDWDNFQDAVRKKEMCHGAKHPYAKLDDAKIAEIRTLYAAGGVTVYDLGIRFGVCFSNIGRIVRRETWKHVP